LEVAQGFRLVGLPKVMTLNDLEWPLFCVILPNLVALGPVTSECLLLKNNSKTECETKTETNFSKLKLRLEL